MRCADILHTSTERRKQQRQVLDEKKTQIKRFSRSRQRSQAKEVTPEEREIERQNRTGCEYSLFPCKPPKIPPADPDPRSLTVGHYPLSQVCAAANSLSLLMSWSSYRPSTPSHFRVPHLASTEVDFSVDIAKAKCCPQKGELALPVYYYRCYEHSIDLSPLVPSRTLALCG